MLSAEFLNQLYVKSNWVNQRVFVHAVIDWKMIKVDLNIFTWMRSQMLLANQIIEFSN